MPRKRKSGNGIGVRPKKRPKKRKYPSIHSKRPKGLKISTMLGGTNKILVAGIMLAIEEELIANYKLKGKNNRMGFRTSKHLSMGRSVNTLNLHGFEKRHTWRRGQGVYMKSIEDRYPADTFKGKLWRLAYQLLEHVDPWYAKDQDYVLQITQMHPGDVVPKHVDGHDACYQLAFTMGNFTGGQLRIYSTQNINEANSLVPKLYNNRNKVLKFDGRYVHDVTRLLSGTRYSVIFYKLWDRRLKNPQPLLVAPVFL